jgi:preprotein translocase subunit SecG
MSVLLAIFTFVLILVSLFLILVVLMQKAKSDGGMGAAMGGGMAEATFGADTGNVLSKATINGAIIFFVLSFGLYLGWIYQVKHVAKTSALPTIAAPMTPAPLPASAPLAPAQGITVPSSATPAANGSKP